MNISVRTAKTKFLSEAMLNAAREHATYLEKASQPGTAVMLNLLVADIEAYREAFKGATFIINHAGGMLKRQDGDISEASRSLALTQLKLSVLAPAASSVLAVIDRKIAEGCDGWPALIGAAEELRGAIELAK
jgi:hypothetical protein